MTPELFLALILLQDNRAYHLFPEAFQHRLYLRTYHLCAKGTDLKCTLTATDYLLANDKEEMLPYVRIEPIVYRWIDGKYRRYE